MGSRSLCMYHLSQVIISVCLSKRISINPHNSSKTLLPFPKEFYFYSSRSAFVEQPFQEVASGSRWIIAINLIQRSFNSKHMHNGLKITHWFKIKYEGVEQLPFQ